MSYGKFDSEKAEAMYSLTLEGGHDEEIGSVDELGWAGKFNDEHIIIIEDQQGFVWLDEYDSREEVDEAWERIEEDYDLFDYGEMV